MIRRDRALVRIDGYEGNPWRGVFPGERRIGQRIAPVVVQHFFLFHRDRRDIGKRAVGIVRSLEVEEEGRDGVAVMLHSRFHVAYEADDGGIGEPGFGQVRRATRGGEIGTDQRVKPRRGDQRIGFAKLEDAPVGMTISTPPDAIARQLKDVAPSEGLVRPAQCRRHRLWHPDHQR